MDENTTLLAAVARLLDYLHDRDVADEIAYEGKGFRAWKSDEFRRHIKETQEALDAVKHKHK